MGMYGALSLLRERERERERERDVPAYPRHSRQPAPWYRRVSSCGTASSDFSKGSGLLEGRLHSKKTHGATLHLSEGFRTGF
ncbi:hypothetical protein GJAV_G00030140 [Gymnothorax javanicus]|nr:hypothetical protein GJAV_G00030140 [Gymnothorax javanicus]